MAKIEAETLTNVCFADCDVYQFIVNTNGVVQCEYVDLCKTGATAILKELQSRFEEKNHEAYKKDLTGMKEHIVWEEAIKIVEEYL